MLPFLVRSMYKFFFSLKSYLTENKVRSPRQPGRDSLTPRVWLTQPVVLVVYLSFSLFSSDFPEILVVFSDYQHSLRIRYTAVGCTYELDEGKYVQKTERKLGTGGVREVVCKYHNSTELVRVFWWRPSYFPVINVFCTNGFIGILCALISTGNSHLQGYM
jgi:hypothetical protein